MASARIAAPRRGGRHSASHPARGRREPHRLRGEGQPGDVQRRRRQLRREQSRGGRWRRRRGALAAMAEPAHRARHAGRSRRRAGSSRARSQVRGAAPGSTVQPWQYAPLTDEQLRNPLNIIPPDQRPRVALRFGEQQGLLVSGLLDGGTDIAQRPVVVDAPARQGARSAVREQPGIPGRDHRELFPGVQHDSELRQPERREKLDAK